MRITQVTNTTNYNKQPAFKSYISYDTRQIEGDLSKAGVTSKRLLAVRRALGRLRKEFQAEKSNDIQKILVGSFFDGKQTEIIIREAGLSDADVSFVVKDGAIIAPKTPLPYKIATDLRAAILFVKDGFLSGLSAAHNAQI